MGDVPQAVLDLIEKFDRNIDEYKNPTYNETLIRVEFVNPFFKALGWDVDNKAGYALAYRDVIHEDAVKVAGATKAPDYSFRIGGTRKFFVETKKPSVNLKDDPAPAFQLRRYAYSARLPISILTDFEEFIVYGCRAKPSIKDKPSADRIRYYTFRDYADKWDEISSVFHRESILRGSFDKYAQDARGKRGTAEIDRDFLADLDQWRLALAHNFALRNPSLTVRELNFAVQMTIDRLIFLRMCEDRGIENYGQLEALVNGTRIYPRLVEVYRKADDRYNSGLFHFTTQKGDVSHPDVLTPELSLDDKVLKAIIQNLYYPKCPYEFSLLPVEVLGNAYEQFLGKTIRLTAGHQAKIEEKPEVRKAGGVYYTPEYIVSYIVKNTVGKLLEGKTPKDVADIRILDPACGSGSFLLGAYRYLLDWHLGCYKGEMERTGKLPTVPPPKGKRKRKSDPDAIFQGQGGDWLLTTAEKKRILLNNIYGVDIDQQAVEVTKLSLLLRVLENENQDTLNRQLTLWRERALPDLGDNIKCGNSLIGPDYLDGQLLPDEEEIRRVNPFDWNAEFPEIMKAGGFDAVISNPPYVRQELLVDSKGYFQTHYKVFDGTADLYVYFIERGLMLLREQGIFSYIVANKWMRANYGANLRKWLKDKSLEEIVDFGDLPVFQKATTYPCIIRVAKNKPEKSMNITVVKTLEFHNLQEYVAGQTYAIERTKLDNQGWSLSDDSTQELLEKIKNAGIPLGGYVKGEIYRGVLTGLNEVFVIDTETRARLIAEDKKSEEIIKPFLLGRDVKRYQPPLSKRFLIFTRRGIDIKGYPAIHRYLSQYKEKLIPKPKGWKGVEWKGRKPGNYQWYEIQDAVDYYGEFEKPKIIIPAIIKCASYTFDDGGIYSNDKTSIISTNDLFLLGVLNSRLADFFMRSICSTKQGGYFEYKPMYIRQIPIKVGGDITNHGQIEKLTHQIVTLHKELPEAKTGHEQDLIRRRIDATDRQIDRLVYELYDLTSEEIEVVEQYVR